MLNQVHFGDCRESLRSMAAAGVRVQMCVTSPPYFGLRDYGHDGQIGLEDTPEQFIAELVEVFRCVRDVLADDGTLWINIGDSYATGTTASRVQGKRGLGAATQEAQDAVPRIGTPEGCKTKDLIGIPWMLAFALRADGWYLRQDIIWHKPNPMPESVTDRCTKAHEYVFLLSKSPRYYYDHEAVKENAVSTAPAGNKNHKYADAYATGNSEEHRTKAGLIALAGVEWETRNRRSVWTIATKPYSGAHFAVFPSALVEPCILAGSRPPGKRCDCADVIGTPTGTGAVNDPSMEVGRAGMSRPRRDGEGTRPISKLEQRHHANQMRQSPHRTEMEALCGSSFAHYIRTDASGARPLPEGFRQQFMANGWITLAPECNCPIFPGDVVLDCFMGSGTTAALAIEHGRQFIGCELNAEYKPLQDQRIAEAHSALAEAQAAAELAARQQDMFAEAP